MAWIRSENNLTRLLPICFVANTNSLQSELRCVWLFQKRMKTLPAGTELTCGETEMVLVLPVASLTEISLPELQLNSPTCSVTYNSTYLTAHISFGSLVGTGSNTTTDIKIGDKLKQLDLYVVSNCSVDRAEMVAYYITWSRIGHIYNNRRNSDNRSHVSLGKHPFLNTLLDKDLLLHLVMK
uniref:Uncharacterized protein n=1 Tax=Nothobranchius korthausae TaxID=1143690 RepID=A0A1A8FV62_9TELE